MFPLCILPLKMKKKKLYKPSENDSSYANEDTESNIILIRINPTWDCRGEH